MRKSLTMLCLCAALTSACSTGGAKRPIASTPPTPDARFRTPQIQRGSDLDSVIGKGAASLARRFGTARIDLSEGEARKLQFISANCVLDIFLYPLERSTAPVATHVEARRRVGGGDTDRARCIAEIERSASGG